MAAEPATASDPEAVIAALRAAGLRQKGGEGRPLAESWQACRELAGPGTVVICNAVDADRRAAVARHVLHTNLEAVLEGLCIAAQAVGAGSCVLCVDSNYDEWAALEKAVADVTPAVRLEKVSASLVTGEETALIRALEGRQPLPYLRLADDMSGVGGATTLIESAETLAAVAALFGEEGAGGGAPAKVMAVFGDVLRPCTLEVPVGTTVRSVVEQAEGRSMDRAEIKAVQLGGPAGRFLAGDELDMPLAYEDLERAGVSFGWGGLEVFAAGRCGVEMARDVTARLHEESCGKCVFCREGSRQVLDILNDIVEGKATEEQVELLHELGEAMRGASICSVGRGAALPALSALDLFADDFAAHLTAKRCPGAGR